MRSEYPYALVDGHMVLNVGASALMLDTGAPCSVGSSSPLDFAGRCHDVAGRYLGVTPESLSGYVGTSISGLVGADILNEYDVLVDPDQRRIVLSEEELPIDGDRLPLDLFMGIPIIEAIVSGEAARMFFDTGAKLSYLSPELGAEFLAAGEETDFYPGIGEFTTQTYSVPVVLGGRETVLRAGLLPALLQATLTIANAGGILVTAILNAYTVLFAPRRRILALKARKG